MSYRGMEKCSGKVTPHKEVRQILQLSAQHAKLAESLDALDNTDSVFAAYLRFEGTKGLAMQRTEEYRASDDGSCFQGG